MRADLLPVCSEVCLMMMTDSTMQFDMDAVERRLKDLKLNTLELSRRANVSKPTVISFLRRPMGVRITNAEAILKALGLSMAQIVSFGPEKQTAAARAQARSRRSARAGR